jgi:hypothetical protein
VQETCQRGALAVLRWLDRIAPAAGGGSFEASKARRDVRIQSGQLVSLGYGKFVRSDEVVAIEPIVEERGPGQRSMVWVKNLAEPLVASRAEGSIVDDLVTPADEAARMREQRRVLSALVTTLEKVSPALRRVLDEEVGGRLGDIVEDARRVLG